MTMIHGGDIYRNQVQLDFSVNTNPLGMPVSVKKALQEAVEKSGNYPDIRSEGLAKAVAAWGGFREEMLVFGNGASELLLAIVHAERPEKILIPVPSFYGYEKAAKASGGEVIYWNLRKEDSYCLTKDFLEVLREDISMVFLANPNNPVGNLIEPRLLETVAKTCRDKGIILVLDECFIELAGKEKTHSLAGKLEDYPNVIILRAFTKLFAMPGVRLGYLICEKKLGERIKKHLPEWNLSVFAQEAGAAAAAERGFVEQSSAYIETERQYLTEILEKQGFFVYPGEADFLFFSTCGKNESKKEKNTDFWKQDIPLYDLLLERGILIRDCGNFRSLQKGYYRIAVKSREENKTFAKILQEVLKTGKKDGENGLEYVKPGEIEGRSFEIISRELEERKIKLPEETAFIVKRVIHTSADFSYAGTMTFSEGAVAVAKELIRQGADLVTDTNMALSGINKKVLEAYGGCAHCYMAEESVAEEAKMRQTTRAAVSMERAAALKKPVIFVVGNAPTALVKLYEMIESGSYMPAFIIGVPVGFVNVEAAKEMILKTSVPYIINRGRKGGSNVAAAICNAILYSLRET